jgi:restriction system protein
MNVPKYDELLNPTLLALHKLGGSASIAELNETVVDQLQLPQDVVEHPGRREGTTLLAERLNWARVYLKKVGLITNSERGVWALTPDGQKIKKVNPNEVKRAVRQQQRERRAEDSDAESSDILDDLNGTESADWKDTLLEVVQDMAPPAFERLCQRLLRESGFIEVKVTGKSGDGGIDGHGIVKLAGLLSFPIIFQAKRYKGSVGAGEIRNFRGAMVGRADKGLFITTGSFTSSAYAEATRDGAPPIDLIDGDQLAEKLKELRLGIKTRMVEAVEVDTEWFRSI